MGSAGSASGATPGAAPQPPPLRTPLRWAQCGASVMRRQVGFAQVHRTVTKHTVTAESRPRGHCHSDSDVQGKGPISSRRILVYPDSREAFADLHHIFLLKAFQSPHCSRWAGFGIQCRSPWYLLSMLLGRLVSH